MKPIINTIERRILANPVELVKRSDEENSRRVEGFAFKYNVWSKRIWNYFRERIAPGALEGCDMSDVKAYFNHDSNLILARTMAGNLELNNNEIGLKYGFDAPITTYGNDLLINLENKNVQHSSFAFQVLEDEWEKDPEFEDGEIRTITKFKLIDDVSPVVNPAYPDATSYKRNIETMIIERQKLRGATDAEVRDYLEQIQHELFMIKHKTL